MSKITISAEDYAAQFGECKVGERVSGTYSGTVTMADETGAEIETDELTKEGEEEEEEAPPPKPAKGKRSPAVSAILKGRSDESESMGY